ncbi:MAG: WcaI family glycosyltransferase, partial [Sphingobacteriaceae bacterium]
ILLIGYNYAPELTGIGKYSGEMGAYLAQQGYEVQVITGFPYYPDWKVSPAYRNGWYHKENMAGAKVWRCPLYVPARPSGFKRILQELSFFISSFFALNVLLLQRKKYDLLMVVSPSFLSGWVGLWYRLWNRKTRMIYHVQDLQIDAARDLGLLKNHTLLKILFSLEKFVLRKSDRISTISPGMQQKIMDKGIDRAKTFLLPNWVDVAAIRPLPQKESLRKELGLKDSSKVILYSGNLGEKQGLSALVELSKALSEVEDVELLICGAGAAKAGLMARAEGLKNIHFVDLQPVEKLPALLATADIHLVLQKKAASDLVMPSKLTGIWAAGGCAVITAAPGTNLYQLVKEHHLGILAEPDSDEALLAAVKQALSQNLAVYRKNARTYAEERLSKGGILSAFDVEIKQILPAERLA